MKKEKTKKNAKSSVVKFNPKNADKFLDGMKAAVESAVSASERRSKNARKKTTAKTRAEISPHKAAEIAAGKRLGSAREFKTSRGNAARTGWRAYDLHQIALALYLRDGGDEAIAEFLGVSVHTIRSWKTKDGWKVISDRRYSAEGKLENDARETKYITTIGNFFKFRTPRGAADNGYAGRETGDRPDSSNSSGDG